jgi:hypothetical protein
VTKNSVPQNQYSIFYPRRRWLLLVEAWPLSAKKVNSSERTNGKIKILKE